MKRKIAILSFLLMTLSSLCLAACAKKDAYAPKKQAALTVSESAVELSEEDTYTLSATRDNSSAAIIWSSSDDSKVKITSTEEDGDVSKAKLSAECVTSAAVTITASIVSDGKVYKAECSVVVKESDKPLVIVNENITDKTVSLYKYDDEIDLYATTFSVFSGSAQGKKKNAAFVWQLANGYEDVAEIIDNGDGEFAFKGIKAGEAQYVLYAESGKKTAFYTLTVTVKEKTPSLVFTNADVVDGRIAKRLKTEGADKTYIPTYDVKYGLSSLSNEETDVKWSVAPNDKITVDEATGAITALARTDLSSEKFVTVTATITYNSKKYTDFVNIYVDAVEKRIETVTEFLETYKESNSIFLTDNVEGDTSNAVLSMKNPDDGNVLYGLFGGYNAKEISLNNGVFNVKTDKKYLGDDIEYTFSTSLCDYVFILPTYTKIIGTKDDLDAISGVNKIADAAADDDPGDQYGDFKIFGGYYVLSGDITYNGDYFGICGGAWFNGANSSTGDDYKAGFNGVIDGKGYSIKGLKILPNGVDQKNFGGFITTVKKGGVIKNISFPSAKVENSAFLASHSVGRQENVFIQYDSIKFTTTNGWEHISVSFDVDTTTAEYIHCFVDASSAKTEIAEIAISGGVNAKAYLTSQYNTLTESYGVYGAYKFADDEAVASTVQGLKENSEAQTVMSESFDRAFWRYIADEGRVAPQSCYDPNAVLSITGEGGKTDIVSGTTLKLEFSDNKPFMVFTLDAPDGVTFDGEKIFTTSGVVGNGKLTARYLFDKTITVEFIFTVSAERVYTVTYVDESGNTIHTEQVKSGGRTTYVPQAASRDGDTVTMTVMYDESGAKIKYIDNVSSDRTVTVKTETYTAKKITLTPTKDYVTWFTFDEKTTDLADSGICKTAQVLSSSRTDGANAWITSDFNYGNCDSVFFYIRVTREWGKMPKLASSSNWVIFTEFIKSDEWVKVEMTKNADGTYNVVCSDGQTATNVPAGNLYFFVSGSASDKDVIEISEMFCKN